MLRMACIGLFELCPAFVRVGNLIILGAYFACAFTPPSCAPHVCVTRVQLAHTRPSRGQQPFETVLALRLLDYPRVRDHPIVLFQDHCFFLNALELRCLGC
jgi:hypothetical protein